MLAWESFRAARDYSAPLIATALALVAAVVLPGQMLMVALIAYFCILLARFWSPRLDAALTWRQH